MRYNEWEEITGVAPRSILFKRKVIFWLRCRSRQRHGFLEVKSKVGNQRVSLFEAQIDQFLNRLTISLINGRSILEAFQIAILGRGYVNDLPLAEGHRIGDWLTLQTGSPRNASLKGASGFGS